MTHFSFPRIRLDAATLNERNTTETEFAEAIARTPRADSPRSTHRIATAKTPRAALSANFYVVAATFVDAKKN
jgi:hypothetical protein